MKVMVTRAITTPLRMAASSTETLVMAAQITLLGVRPPDSTMLAGTTLPAVMVVPAMKMKLSVGPPMRVRLPSTSSPDSARYTLGPQGRAVSTGMP